MNEYNFIPTRRPAGGSQQLVLTLLRCTSTRTVLAMDISPESRPVSDVLAGLVDKLPRAGNSLVEVDGTRMNIWVRSQ